MKLRDYQSAAVEAAIASLRRSLAPILIEAATGAGKSHMIAALAGMLTGLSGGRFVLCLAPSKELVVQNAKKYWLTGEPCSFYSASVGEKNLSGPVVFGTPVSVANAVERFAGKVGAVVLDECHSISPTIHAIVERLRESYPHLRVIGLTATPFRLGEGYIYRHHENRAYGDSQARAPWFDRCVYKVRARELIDRGFLTPPVVGDVGDTYDTAGLELNRMQRFDPASVERTFVGHGRLTSRIIGEVVAKSAERQGALIFAATRAHARECLASLPPSLSAMVDGETPARLRDATLSRFLAREIKYLVNIQVLSIGFDAPHVDTIAILRRTESAGLFQQIVGRGLRTCEGKTDCLILDYADNIENHCPDGDIFDPAISALPPSKDRPAVDVVCPRCRQVNVFKLSADGEKHGVDEHGYCLDLTGLRIRTNWGDLPGHHGRRCLHEGCDYRWTAKTCPKCKTENDIAARRCSECDEELIDPNEKLAREFRKFKSDPTQTQTDKVLAMSRRSMTTKKGQPMLKVSFKTEWRTVDIFLLPTSKNVWHMRRARLFSAATFGKRKPKTITYRKNPKTGYFDVIAYDRDEPDSDGIQKERSGATLS